MFMSITMHVHITDIKDFLRSYGVAVDRYIANKAACVSKYDYQHDKMNILAFINIYSSKFSQTWFVNIFHRQNFAPYGSWIQRC